MLPPCVGRIVVIQSDVVTDHLSRKDIRVPSLAELHSDATEQLILDGALRSLVRHGEVTARAAARECGISERTVFRYFPARGELLAAAAAALLRGVRAPAPPRSVVELRAMPRALFTAFDEHRDLIAAAWHSELRAHVIATQAKERWVAIRKLLDSVAPAAPERRRKLAAATMRYHLSATTWHYYRFVLRLTLAETIEATETVIAQHLRELQGA
jgi:AcrR family transcriptional regulator